MPVRPPCAASSSMTNRRRWSSWRGCFGSTRPSGGSAPRLTRPKPYGHFGMPRSTSPSSRRGCLAWMAWSSLECSSDSEPPRRVTAARQAANLADFAAAALWPGAAKAGANSMAVPGGADTDDDAIPVELGGTTKLVPRSSVRWVEARGDYARLHTSDGSHLIRARLTALADCWRNAGWIRIHRSYLVQLRCIADVRVADSKQMTVVVDGHQLPVSRRLAPKLRNRLLNAARMTTLATT